MWFGLGFRALRTYAPYITLPFAAVVGYLGYKIESSISRKHTPYNDPIKESRSERRISDESLQSAAEIEKLKYSSNVLGQNLAPSLQ